MFVLTTTYDSIKGADDPALNALLFAVFVVCLVYLLWTIWKGERHDM